MAEWTGLGVYMFLCGKLQPKVSILEIFSCSQLITERLHGFHLCLTAVLR